MLAYSSSALLHLENEKPAAATAVIQALFTIAATVSSVHLHIINTEQYGCALQQLTSCQLVFSAACLDAQLLSHENAQTVIL